MVQQCTPATYSLQLPQRTSRRKLSAAEASFRLASASARARMNHAMHTEREKLMQASHVGLLQTLSPSTLVLLRDASFHALGLQSSHQNSCPLLATRLLTTSWASQMSRAALDKSSLSNCCGFWRRALQYNPWAEGQATSNLTCRRSSHADTVPVVIAWMPVRISVALRLLHRAQLHYDRCLLRESGASITRQP